MYEILDWWINSYPLTEDEKIIINKGRSTIAETTTNDQYNILCDCFYSRIPFSHLSSKTHELGLAIYATTLIQQLFKNYVTDDTLVICTDGEHNSARSCIEKSKNVLYLKYYNDIIKNPDVTLKNILKESKKYKNVFIYIIGTQISNGVIVPQIFFEKLKQLMVENNIIHTLTIDDVHGMFTVPRNYTIFDYIIYTTHALVLGYDLGMIIYKKENIPIGYKIYNWLKDYLVCLDIILKRSEKIYTFKPVFFEVFSAFSKFNNFSMPEYGAPQIFSPKFKIETSAQNMRKELHDYKLSIDVSNENEFVIRNRIGTLIAYTEKDIALYKEGLNILYNYMEIIN